MKDKNCDLQTCFLCKHCIPEWKELIGLRKKTISVKKGKTIFAEGEPVKGIFFMYEGAAKVAKNWGPHKELVLRFATDGHLLGHRGFGGEAVYPVSSTALQNSKVCFIDNELLATIIQTNPNFTYQLMKVYAMELQQAERKMRDLVHMDVKGRIAGALLEIAEVFGTNQDGYLAFPVSRQDIASVAGTTYETVFKVFNEMLDRHLITVSGKYIRINDHKQLHERYE